MNIRPIQPRGARIALVGLAAAALSIIAVPGSVGASPYPPSPPPQQSPPVLVPPVQVPPQSGVLGGGGGSNSLPATGGSDPAQILWIASGALLAGVAISGASLRRRNAGNTADNAS